MAILDHRGNPMSYHWEGGTLSRDRGLPVHFISPMGQDTKVSLSTGTRNDMRNAGRWLFANSPIVRGAFREMASYAFPLIPSYTGKDKAWGDIAESWLKTWCKNEERRGANYSGVKGSRLRFHARKTDGDFLILLTTDASGRFPRIKHVRGHRIHNGKPTADEIRTKRLIDGVLVDRDDAPKKYRVQFGDKATETRDIPARGAALVFNPDYIDQYRGISELGVSIASFADIKQLREWDMYANKMAAGLVFTEHNEDGEPLPQSDFQEASTGTDTSGTASGQQTQVFEQGMTRFFKSSDRGSKLEQVSFDRPSSESQAFEAKIVRQALYGIGWDPDFALALQAPGGAWARTVIEKVRRQLILEQDIERDTLRRIHTYALGFAIKHGLLPVPDDAEWFKHWKYTGPMRITADSGNERKATLEEYKSGTRTYRTIAEEQGGHWLDDREQREVEVEDLCERANRLSEKTKFSPETCLNLLEQRNPNPEINGTETNQQDDA